VSGPLHSSSFAPTRWTLVLRARGETPEARAALSDLCESYYQPVLRFLCREGRDEGAARELAQEFFARVLASGGFHDATAERGRFRSYLLGALKHFLADQRKYAQRLKRGGGLPNFEDAGDAPAPESADLQVADDSAPIPGAFFDREWALALMERALSVVEQDYGAAARSEQFQALKPWLMGHAPAISQAMAAQQLGMSEGAVKVAVHRLRKRFREAVRSEILQTVRDPALVDEELQHLIAALS
jgi:DNA-directed RNA polymerase specialized sigma24 family protein